MSGILVIVLVFIVLAGVLGGVAYWTYQHKLRRAKAIERGLKMVPVLIHLPPPSADTVGNGRDVREVMREKTAQAEMLYNLLGGTATEGFKSHFYGQRHIALEVVAVDGVVHFYAAVPVALVSVVSKAIQTAYPGARLEEVEDHNIFNQEGRLAATLGGEMVLRQESAYPIATYDQLERDPMEALINTVTSLDKKDGAAVQIMLRPAGRKWTSRSKKLADGKRKGRPQNLSFSAMDLAKAAIKSPDQWREEERARLGGGPDISNLQLGEIEKIEEKTKHPGFEVLIRVVVSTQSVARSQQLLRDIATTFALFETPGLNGFKFLPAVDVQGLVTAFIFRFFPPEIRSSVLNSVELATLFHLPDSQFTPTMSVERQRSKQVDGPVQLPTQGLLFGHNEFRGIKKEIRLSDEDRRRHTYILGQTGTGKSTLLENLALQDMLNGNGFAFIDPHGDSAEKLLAMVPKERSEDVIYFNPADTEFPLGLNLFEFSDPTQKDFLVQETINMLYKLYDPGKTGIIGPRYEHWYRNAALTLMSDPHGATFIEIPKVFTDTEYLKQKFKYLRDPTVIDFWVKEMGQTSDYHKSEMLGWFVSKFGAFQNNEMMRNIIGQTKSSFNMRDIMDGKKILIVNLSKGRIGELNSQLLGMIFVIKFQAAAMSRADVAESERSDFCLYVDEFQNFSTDSFASILSEARKYRLNLIVANQFIGQLSNEIRDAVFGNIGTIVAHRMGPDDAEFMVKQFAPVFDASDLVNIPNFNAAMRLMIGGLPSQPFTMKDLAPLGAPNLELGLAIKQLSAAKFGHAKSVVEQDIAERLTAPSASTAATQSAQSPAPTPEPLAATPATPTVTASTTSPAPVVAPAPQSPLPTASVQQSVSPGAMPAQTGTPTNQYMAQSSASATMLPAANQTSPLPNQNAGALLATAAPLAASGPAVAAPPAIPQPSPASYVSPAALPQVPEQSAYDVNTTANPQGQMPQPPLVADSTATQVAPLPQSTEAGFGDFNAPLSAPQVSPNNDQSGMAMAPPPIGAPPVDLSSTPVMQPTQPSGQTTGQLPPQSNGGVGAMPGGAPSLVAQPMASSALAEPTPVTPYGINPPTVVQSVPVAPAPALQPPSLAVSATPAQPLAPPPIGAPPIALPGDPGVVSAPTTVVQQPVEAMPAGSAVAAQQSSNPNTLTLTDITGGQLPTTSALSAVPVMVPGTEPSQIASSVAMQPEAVVAQTPVMPTVPLGSGQPLEGDPYANIDVLADLTPPEPNLPPAPEPQNSTQSPAVLTPQPPAAAVSVGPALPTDPYAGVDVLEGTNATSVTASVPPPAPTMAPPPVPAAVSGPYSGAPSAAAAIGPKQESQGGISPQPSVQNLAIEAPQKTMPSMPQSAALPVPALQPISPSVPLPAALPTVASAAEGVPSLPAVPAVAPYQPVKEVLAELPPAEPAEAPVQANTEAALAPGIGSPTQVDSAAVPSSQQPQSSVSSAPVMAGPQSSSQSLAVQTQPADESIAKVMPAPAGELPEPSVQPAPPDSQNLTAPKVSESTQDEPLIHFVDPEAEALLNRPDVSSAEQSNDESLLMSGLPEGVHIYEPTEASTEQSQAISGEPSPPAPIPSIPPVSSTSASVALSTKDAQVPTVDENSKTDSSPALQPGGLEHMAVTPPPIGAAPVALPASGTDTPAPTVPTRPAELVQSPPVESVRITDNAKGSEPPVPETNEALAEQLQSGGVDYNTSSTAADQAGPVMSLADMLGKSVPVGSTGTAGASVSSDTAPSAASTLDEQALPSPKLPSQDASSVNVATDTTVSVEDKVREVLARAKKIEAKQAGQDIAQAQPERQLTPATDAAQAPPPSLSAPEAETPQLATAAAAPPNQEDGSAVAQGEPGKNDIEVAGGAPTDSSADNSQPLAREADTNSAPSPEANTSSQQSAATGSAVSPAEQVERTEQVIDNLLGQSLIHTDTSPTHHRLPEPRLPQGDESSAELGLESHASPATIAPQAPAASKLVDHHGLKIIQPLEPIVPPKEKFAKEIAALKASDAADVPAESPSKYTKPAQQTSRPHKPQQPMPAPPAAQIIKPKILPEPAKSAAPAINPAAPIVGRVIRHGGQPLPSVANGASDEGSDVLPKAESLAADQVARARAGREAAQAMQKPAVEPAPTSATPTEHRAEAAREITVSVGPGGSKSKKRHQHHEKPGEHIESAEEAEHNKPTELEQAHGAMTGKLIMPTGEKPAAESEPMKLQKPKKLAPGEVFVDEHGNVVIGE